MSPEKIKYIHNLDDPIFIEIGKAVSLWASVEDCVFEIYMKSINLPEEICAIAFYAMGTFNNRIDLTSKTIKTLSSQEETFYYWQALYDATKAIGRARNFIAHNPVNYIFYDDNPTASFDGRAVLVKDSYESKYRGGERQEKQAAEIAEIVADIKALHYELMRFQLHLVTAPSPSPYKFLIQDLDQRLEKYLPVRPQTRTNQRQP